MVVESIIVRAPGCILGSATHDISFDTVKLTMFGFKIHHVVNSRNNHHLGNQQARKILLKISTSSIRRMLSSAIPGEPRIVHFTFLAYTCHISYYYRVL